MAVKDQPPDNGGWIIIYKKIQKWGWYSDSQTFHLFMHLLLEANHENRIWKGQEIKRGQLIFGRKRTSECLGISEQAVRTCITRLKSTNEITIKSTNKYSLITIVNYEKYQLTPKKSTSKSTSNYANEQPTTNQQPTTPNKVNKRNKVNKKEKGENFDSPFGDESTPFKVEQTEKYRDEYYGT